MKRFIAACIVGMSFGAIDVASVSAQSTLPPAIPGCTCSTGSEIPYPAPAGSKKVFAANCICGPQFCAATWNDDISLQCVPGAENTGPRPNCADFTRMKIGKYGFQMKAGLFDVAAIPAAGTTRELEVTFNDIQTSPPTDGPNGLHSTPALSFTYPMRFKTAQISLATYMGGGNYVSVVTGKNEVVSFPYAADPVHGKTINLTVQHADGIKSLRFPANEVLVFEVCAVDPPN